GLLRPSSPSSCLGSTLNTRSWQVAVSPCGEEDLPDVLSAPLSLRAWPPPPAVRGVPRPVASATPSACPSCGPGRRLAQPVQRVQDGALVEAAVLFLRGRPAGVLATPSAPPATVYTIGQP